MLNTPLLTLQNTIALPRKLSSSAAVSESIRFGAAPKLSERFEEALALANQLHQTQLRKGTEIPYVAHLLGVASIVLEHGGGEDEAIAAVLHDAVEDQGGQPTLALIRKQFGDTVADIVAGCTDADVMPKPPWRERKEAYIAHVATAPANVRLVSASDKLHNARSILNDYHQNGDAVWEKFKGGKEGTLWYYRSLITVFKKHGDSPLLQELDRTVVQLERLANPKPSLWKRTVRTATKWLNAATSAVVNAGQWTLNATKTGWSRLKAVVMPLFSKPNLPPD